MAARLLGARSVTRRLLPLLPLTSVFLGLSLFVVWKEHRDRLPDLRLAAGVAAGVLLAWRVVAGWRVARRVSRHRERVDALARFARSLHDGHLQAPGFFDSGAAVVVGVRRGRRVRLIVQREQVVLEAWVHHPAASFDLTRPALPDRLGRAVARAVGPTWRVRRQDGLPPGALERAEVERALRRLFVEHGVTRLALAGALRAERPLRDRDLDLDALDEAFDLLAQVAAPLDRQEVVVRAARGRSFAWTGGGGGLRCPYCRDGLSLDDERLAPCGACRTLHHVDCLDEAGGCTVMGCAGGPERSGARRRVEA